MNRPIARPVASNASGQWSSSVATTSAKGRTTPSSDPHANRRRYITAAVTQSLRESLSERDRAVLVSLRTLRVATAEQLERLHFTTVSNRHRRRALEGLEERRLIIRLPRQIGGVRAGSAGSVFALDLAGQRLTDGRGPVHGRRLERPWTPGLAFLAHNLAVTELYVRLVEAHRRGQLELLDFAAEPGAWRNFQTASGRATLKPDGRLRLGAGAFEDHWFIEVDRGTEAPSTIQRKAKVYRDYWASGQEQASLGTFPLVLWLTPDQGRADLLVDVLARETNEARCLHVVVPFAAALPRLIEGPGEQTV